jgi:hypothetical protein
MENTGIEPRGSSAVGSLAKRAVAWIVLIAAALVALKVIAGAVIGIVTTLFTIALIVVVIGAVIWALRRL